MIDSGEMVGELVGGNVAVLWAMAEVFSGGRRSKNGVPNRAEAGGAPAPHLLGSGGERLGRRRFWPRFRRWDLGCLRLGGTAMTWGERDRYDFVVDGLRGCGGCRSSQRTGQARMAVTVSIPAGTPWSLIDRMRLMR
jgi:hypothetical protein